MKKIRRVLRINGMWMKKRQFLRGEMKPNAIISNSCEGRLRRPCTREIHSVSRTFKPIEQNYCKAAPAQVKFIKSLGLLNNLNRIT